MVVVVGEAEAAAELVVVELAEVAVGRVTAAAMEQVTVVERAVGQETAAEAAEGARAVAAAAVAQVGTCPRT